MHRRAAIGAGLAFTAFGGRRSHAAVARPDGEVILTITGKIASTNGTAGLELDREQLLGLGTASITTSSVFTPGIAAFKGVLLSRVLDLAGASGESLLMTALNDYTTLVPASDAVKFGPILATEQDGHVLRVRDRGPIWLVYPWNRMTAADAARSEARSIWQLRSIEVR